VAHHEKEIEMNAEKMVADVESVINLFTTKPLLITTSNWFRASDGFQYLSVWGIARIISTKALMGFDPASPSTNWLLVMSSVSGDANKTIIIGGCQVNYFAVCPDRPNSKDTLILD
jgi:hypothetical protein